MAVCAYCLTFRKGCIGCDAVSHTLDCDSCDKGDMMHDVKCCVKFFIKKYEVGIGQKENNKIPCDVSVFIGYKENDKVPCDVSVFIGQ